MNIKRAKDKGILPSYAAFSHSHPLDLAEDYHCLAIWKSLSPPLGYLIQCAFIA